MCPGARVEAGAAKAPLLEDTDGNKDAPLPIRRTDGGGAAGGIEGERPDPDAPTDNEDGSGSVPATAAPGEAGQGSAEV